MAYRFIDDNQNAFGLRWLLSRMNIHPNSYYNYRLEKKADYRSKQDEICDIITNTYHSLNGIVGHRSMKIFLERQGIFLSKTTVHKYMNKLLHLHCISRRRKPGYRKGHAHKVFPNLIDHNFCVDAPNKVWCTDFTYMYLSNGTPRYNCAILDLYDRSLVASLNYRWIDTQLAIDTLSKTLESTCYDSSKLILHSNQGTQYTSLEFTMFCKEHGITQSMSKSGCPYDNAPMERYYNSLKHELLNLYIFDTTKELDFAVDEYAYGWYNQIRPHSFNNYSTPFEKRFSLE